MASPAPLVCQRIREYREQRRPKTSQEDIARGLGMSLAGYRKWETATEPSEKKLRRLARYYQSLGDELREDYFIRFAGESEEQWDRRLETEVGSLRDVVEDLVLRLSELEAQAEDR
jgi:transcriptional regulator with XRE-family HTH domain